MSDIYDLPAHPAADVFPMLPEDELHELAGDIAANGLRHPIVIGTHEGERVIVDGRNRREACRLVDVEPTTVEINGADPVAYILSANINRRHMTKGQRAMAVAMLHPEPVKYRRGGVDSSVSEELKRSNVKPTHVSMARTVFREAHAEAGGVLRGETSLDAAYKIAIDRREKASSREAQLERMREAAPDLADKVIEGELALEEAEGALRERQDKERATRAAVFQNVSQLRVVASALSDNALSTTVRMLAEHPGEYETFAKESRAALIEHARAIAGNLETFADTIEGLGQ